MEARILPLFERALAQPAAQRPAWLAGQGEAPEVVARVLELLQAEPDAPGVLDETAVLAEAPPPEFPKVGERLGSYELLKPLEAGGMGVVYLGRRADNVYDQQVAIKLIRPVHLLAAPDFRRRLISRFEAERSILARMSHPNVARILDGGSTAGGIPYLVMEYVDGVSLTDYCKNNKLDVPARLRLFAKVCDGVQEAHRHLIVHRDLKPDNILVGTNGEPRLLDFGIAKILEQDPLVPEKGTSLSAMTPAYASPEQVRQQPLTTSSDVYSLGVVLYQLLAGVRPYELGGLRPSEAEHVVCDTLPDPLRKMLDKAAIPDAERSLRRSQITPDVERIVARAMHKDAPRRYGSAQELADDIRRYLDGQPVQAHPDSGAYRLRKFIHRHRVGTAAAALALAAILGATGVAFWQAGQARKAAADMAQVNEFLHDVLRQSNPYSAGGEISLSEAVDLAQDQVAKRFAGRPELSSGVRFALGYSMLSRNQLAPAREQLELALAESLQSVGPRAAQTFEIREALAQLLISSDRPTEAEQPLKQLIADVEAAGLQAKPIYLLSLNNLGQLYLALERYPEARVYLGRARALPLPAKGTLAADTQAILTSNLAYVAHGLGELDEADRLFTQAEAEFAALRPGGSAELASLLNNRAFLLDDQGKDDEAYAMRKASVAMREQVLGDSHPALVRPLMDLARDAMMRGETDYALEQAIKAVAVAERAYAEPSVDRVYALVMHAGALINAKQFLQSGEVLMRAEAEAATLQAPPDYLTEGLSYTRRELCKRPRTPAVPSCAGIVPTEPALP